MTASNKQEMKNKTNRIYTLVLLGMLIWGTVDAQQLPYRNSFGSQDFTLNPGMTAKSEYMESGAVYQRQWLGFESAPRTTTAYIQYPLVYQNMGLGGYLVQDKAGALEWNSVGLSYSYKIKVGLTYEDQLSVGVLATLGQYSFYGSKTKAFDQGDNLLMDETGREFLPNFGAGVFYTSNTRMYENEESGFFVGLGSSQLLPLELSFDGDSESSFRRVIHANALLGGRIVSDYFFIEPSVWVNYSGGGLIHSTANIMFEMQNAFWAGATYHTDNTFALQVGGIMTEGFLKDGELRFGVKGGFNVGPSAKYKGVGFEFMIAYRFWM